MSVIHTEGFQRFSRGRFYSDYTDVSQVMLPDSTWAHTQAQRSDNANNAESARWPGMTYAAGMVYAGIVADPIVATKNRLACNGGEAGNVSGSTIRRTIRHAFAKPCTHWFMGFLVRAVSGSGTTSINHLNGIGIGHYTQTLRENPISWTGGAANTFRFSPDGVDEVLTLIRGIAGSNTLIPSSTGMYYSANATVGAQPKPLVVNTDYFVEIEIDTVNLISRVWVDDFLVLQTNLSAAGAPLFTAGVSLTLGSYLGGGVRTPDVIGNMLISDMYIVDATDGIAPTTRLGPSTRVWGDTPGGDAEVEFERPASFASNAAVVARPFSANAAPSEYLAGEAVGTEDLYTPTPALSAVATRVYGVTVRVQAANGGSTAHTLSAVADDGTNRAESDLPVVAAGTGFAVRQTVLPVSPTGLPWTPAEIDSVRFGVKIKS